MWIYVNAKDTGNLGLWHTHFSLSLSEHFFHSPVATPKGWHFTPVVGCRPIMRSCRQNIDRLALSYHSHCTDTCAMDENAVACWTCKNEVTLRCAACESRCTRWKWGGLAPKLLFLSRFSSCPLRLKHTISLALKRENCAGWKQLQWTDHRSTRVPQFCPLHNLDMLLHILCFSWYSEAKLLQGTGAPLLSLPMHSSLADYVLSQCYDILYLLSWPTSAQRSCQTHRLSIAVTPCFHVSHSITACMLAVNPTREKWVN